MFNINEGQTHRQQKVEYMYMHTSNTKKIYIYIQADVAPPSYGTFTSVF